jgi:hypothetical protein
VIYLIRCMHKFLDLYLWFSYVKKHVEKFYMSNFFLSCIGAFSFILQSKFIVYCFVAFWFLFFWFFSLFVNVFVHFNITLKVKICCYTLFFFYFYFNPYSFNCYFLFWIFLWNFFFRFHSSTFYFLDLWFFHDRAFDLII